MSSRAGITLRIYHPEIPLMFRISYPIISHTPSDLETPFIDLESVKYNPLYSSS